MLNNETFHCFTKIFFILPPLCYFITAMLTKFTLFLHYFTVYQSQPIRHYTDTRAIYLAGIKCINCHLQSKLNVFFCTILFSSFNVTAYFMCTFFVRTYTSFQFAMFFFLCVCFLIVLITFTLYFKGNVRQGIQQLIFILF